MNSPHDDTRDRPVRSQTRSLDILSDYVEACHEPEEIVFQARDGGNVLGSLLVNILRGPAQTRSPLWHDVAGWATGVLRDAIVMTAEDTMQGLSSAGPQPERLSLNVLRTVMELLDGDVMMQDGRHPGVMPAREFARTASDGQMAELSDHVLGNLPRVFRSRKPDDEVRLTLAA